MNLLRQFMIYSFNLSFQSQYSPFMFTKDVAINSRYCIWINLCFIEVVYALFIQQWSWCHVYAIQRDLIYMMSKELAFQLKNVVSYFRTILKSSSPKLLSALSDIFLKSTKDDGYLQACLYWLKNENLCFCDRLTLLLVRLLQLLVHKHIVVVTASCLVYVCTSSISFNDFCFFYVLEFFCFVWARVFCIFYIFQYQFCLNYLQPTIGEISSISDKSILSNLLGKTIKLETEDQETHPYSLLELLPKNQNSSFQASF